MKGYIMEPICQPPVGFEPEQSNYRVVWFAIWFLWLLLSSHLRYLFNRF